MAKSKQQKKELVKLYRDSLGKSKSVFIVKPSGVTANESVQLKKELYNLGGSYNIVKNTLFKIALKEEGLPELTQVDQNEHAVVFVEENVTEAAKLLNKFAQDTQKIELQAGIIDKKAHTGNQLKQLAQLPSKEILISQLLNVFNAPLTGFLNVLNGNTRNLVQVLKAISDKK